MQPPSFSAPTAPDTMRFVPLGGCGEFGMNLTALLWRERLLVLDCGVKFPDPAKLGIDAIIPDVSPWFREAGGVFAYVLTHGHEDHIGAIPYVVPRWPAPIYATPWTAALLRAKFLKLGMDPNAHPITIIKAGGKIEVDDLSIELVHVNHSIPDTCALYIKTPKVKVFHTADFKLEESPTVEARYDAKRLAAIGAEGVDILLADSTNSEKSGRCPEESDVAPALAEAFKRTPGAALVTTFSSNLWRLKSVADACVAAGRKLYITGNGLEMTLTHAKALGRYHLPETIRVADENLDTFPRERLAVLATGCQGEWRSGMARIASGEHRSFSVRRGDHAIFSSRFIPGNERPILDMMDKLKRSGAEVVTAREMPDIHVSGHAYGGDLEVLAGLLKPKMHVPIHGAYTQLAANRRLGEKLGLRTLLVESGDILEVDANGAKIIGRVETGVQYVDSESHIVLPTEIARERLRIGELGCAFFSAVYGKAQRGWLTSPQLEIFGVRLPDEVDPEGFRRETAQAALELLVSRGAGKSSASLEELTEDVRIAIRRRLAILLNKKPVVVVKLHLV